MNFRDALVLMKQGNKMKLPSWGGYWTWDEEKQTILMHVRPEQSDNGKPVMDIRESQRVEYTLSNVLSNDWIVATIDNTQLLGGEATFGFEEAIKYLKRGCKITRKGWNGKGMWLCLIPAGNAMYNGFDMQDCIGLKTANDEMQPGWLASQSDMLAEDWMFAD